LAHSTGADFLLRTLIAGFAAGLHERAGLRRKAAKTLFSIYGSSRRIALLQRFQTSSGGKAHHGRQNRLRPARSTLVDLLESALCAPLAHLAVGVDEPPHRNRFTHFERTSGPCPSPAARH
jgi:hypothetical protein